MRTITPRDCLEAFLPPPLHPARRQFPKTLLADEAQWEIGEQERLSNRRRLVHLHQLEPKEIHLESLFGIQTGIPRVCGCHVEALLSLRLEQEGKRRMKREAKISLWQAHI